MAAYTSQPPISVTVESGQALSPIKTGTPEQEESMENLGYTSVPALLKYLRQAEQLGLDIDRAWPQPVSRRRTWPTTASGFPARCMSAC